MPASAVFAELGGASILRSRVFLDFVLRAFRVAVCRVNQLPSNRMKKRAQRTLSNATELVSGRASVCRPDRKSVKRSYAGKTPLRLVTEAAGDEAVSERKEEVRTRVDVASLLDAVANGSRYVYKTRRNVKDQNEEQSGSWREGRKGKKACETYPPDRCRCKALRASLEERRASLGGTESEKRRMARRKGKSKGWAEPTLLSATVSATGCGGESEHCNVRSHVSKAEK